MNLQKVRQALSQEISEIQLLSSHPFTIYNKSYKTSSTEEMCALYILKTKISYKKIKGPFLKSCYGKFVTQAAG